MGFRFHPGDDNLQSALRRIAASELTAAIARLPADGAAPPAHVHDVRKRIKKLRGLLRLLEPGFRRFRDENAALRDAGQTLASLRDSAVRLATFDGLFPEVPDTLASVRARLAQDAAEAAAAPASTDAARDILVALHMRAEHWRLDGKDAAILARGLARTRRRALSAQATAEADPSFEALHEWRKQAKHVWYQSRLLAPVWPEVMGPTAASASTLTEDLGLHHDYAVLLDHVGTADAEGLLAARAHAAQSEIEARVFAEGRRLLAGDPADVADLWVAWWRLWRG
jgi:CHAD domain-containing protein